MNESAFPTGDQRGHEPETGMTLRDYFAAKAMQALLPDYQSTASFIAQQAYHYADAMLKARESQAAPQLERKEK